MEMRNEGEKRIKEMDEIKWSNVKNEWKWKRRWGIKKMNDGKWGWRRMDGWKWMGKGS